MGLTSHKRFYEGSRCGAVHIHPEADEVFYVLEGEIIVHAGGTEHPVQEGDFALAPRGVAHAFMATTETRLLCMQTPGTGQAFFRHASEPATSDRIDGPWTSAGYRPPPTNTAASNSSAHRRSHELTSQGSDRPNPMTQPTQATRLVHEEVAPTCALRSKSGPNRVPPRRRGDSLAEEYPGGDNGGAGDASAG